MDATITIVLFEDDGHFATRLKTLLEFQEGFKIVRIFVRFELNCLEELKQIKPSLIILDIGPPLNSPYNGIEACEIIRNTFELQNTKILIMSAHLEDDKISMAIISGADGYVYKSDRENIVPSVRSVLEGDNTYSRSIQNQINKIVLGLIGQEKFDDFKETLTEKEREVWEERSKGKSIKDIAQKMEITIDGINYHIKNYNRKLKSFKASRQSLIDKIQTFLQRKLK